MRLGKINLDRNHNRRKEGNKVLITPAIKLGDLKASNNPNTNKNVTLQNHPTDTNKTKWIHVLAMSNIMETQILQSMTGSNHLTPLQSQHYFYNLTV